MTSVDTRLRWIKTNSVYTRGCISVVGQGNRFSLSGFPFKTQINIFCLLLFFLLLKGSAYFSEGTSNKNFHTGVLGTVTFSCCQSISCYHDFLNTSLMVPKHLGSALTASYQHSVTFHSTCSQTPEKVTSPPAGELCWYVRDLRAKI